MKKLTLIVVAILFTTFTFSQNQGQWSFGAGGDFTAPNADANIGYFIMDNLMLNASFNMGFDYENACMAEVGTVCDVDHEVEGDFDWGFGLRYYAVDNLFLEAAMSTGTGEDPDMSMAGGVSLVLGFEDRLWFEPMIKLSMPGEDLGVASQTSLGLAWAFRYTF